MSQPRPTYSVAVGTGEDLVLSLEGEPDPLPLWLVEIPLDGGSVTVDVRTPEVPHSVTVAGRWLVDDWLPLLVGGDVLRDELAPGQRHVAAAGPLAPVLARLAVTTWWLRHPPVRDGEPVFDRDVLTLDVVAELLQLTSFCAWAEDDAGALLTASVRGTAEDIRVWAKLDPAGAAGDHLHELDRVLALPAAAPADAEPDAPPAAGSASVGNEGLGVPDQHGSTDHDWNAVAPEVLDPSPDSVSWQLHGDRLVVQARGYPRPGAPERARAAGGLVARAVLAGQVLPAALFPLEAVGGPRPGGATFVGEGPVLLLGPSDGLRIEVCGADVLTRPVDDGTWAAGVRARAEARRLAGRRVDAARSSPRPPDALLAEVLVGESDRRVAALLAAALDLPLGSTVTEQAEQLLRDQAQVPLLTRGISLLPGRPANLLLPDDGTLERLTGRRGVRPVIRVVLTEGVVTVSLALADPLVPGARAAVVVEAAGRERVAALAVVPDDTGGPGTLLRGATAVPELAQGGPVAVRVVATGPVS